MADQTLPLNVSDEMKSDDESSTLLDDSGSYEVWKTSILEDKTGEYELRLRAEDTVLRRFSIQQSDEDTDSDVDFRPLRY